ncbi:MAG: hypothetical protein Q9223_006574 [Gallowayella weberi]
MRRNDPRLRQTLNQISQTVDSAQYTTRASLFTFHQTYLAPCLSGISTCLEASCAPCYTCITNAASSNTPADAARRRRTGRRRGREELSFDFYDDWEAQEEEGWGNDELDRLLAGNDFAADGQQPGRRGVMSYGGIGSRRKTGGLGAGKNRGAEEANIVPSSSMFGFLERLPFKIGGKGKRYKPSAADLQDVGEGQRSRTAAMKARASGEDEPLISESESGDEGRKKGQGRKRSGTVGSRETDNSLSSRGDLFPSEDEDDAVPLDDEFAMVLARRSTQGTLSDEHSSKKKPGDSRAASTKTKSSKSSRSTEKKDRRPSDAAQAEVDEHVPSMTDLKEEEERLRLEEETNIKHEREAARRLAAERGLLNPDELQAKPPQDSTKEETPNISIHPVSSHDSRPADNAEVLDDSRFQESIPQQQTPKSLGKEP